MGFVSLGGARAVDAAQPESNRLDFTILRNGEEVGTWHAKFRKVGRDLKVAVRASIDLTALTFRYYRFRQESHETWRDGKLIGLTSRLIMRRTAFKEEHRMILREKDGVLTGEIDGQKVERAVDQVLNSLWDDRILLASQVMHTANAQHLAISVADAGVEVIDVLGQAVPTRRYQIRGEFNRDLWYDGNYVLQRVQWQDGGNLMELVAR